MQRKVDGKFFRLIGKRWRILRIRGFGCKALQDQKGWNVESGGVGWIAGDAEGIRGDKGIERVTFSHQIHHICSKATEHPRTIHTIVPEITRKHRFRLIPYRTRPIGTVQVTKNRGYSHKRKRGASSTRRNDSGPMTMLFRETRIGPRFVIRSTTNRASATIVITIVKTKREFDV